MLIGRRTRFSREMRIQNNVSGPNTQYSPNNIISFWAKSFGPASGLPQV